MPQQRITYCGLFLHLLRAAARPNPVAQPLLLVGIERRRRRGGRRRRGRRRRRGGRRRGRRAGQRNRRQLIGVPVSTCTHDDRSKNMNSSAFSCAVSVSGAVQPIGKRRLRMRAVARPQRDVHVGEHDAPALIGGGRLDRRVERQVLRRLTLRAVVGVLRDPDPAPRRGRVDVRRPSAGPSPARSGRRRRRAGVDQPVRTAPSPSGTTCRRWRSPGSAGRSPTPIQLAVAGQGGRPVRIQAECRWSAKTRPPWSA